MAHDVKQIIVMRKDLGMRKGKMIAQGGHAVLKIFLDRMRYEPNDDHSHVLDVGDEFGVHSSAVLKWMKEGFKKVCVQVNSEEELLQINKEAEEAGLPVALICDSGKTEFNGVATYTCLAIGPASSKHIDKITGGLKLL